jgi:hypothetical protein
LTITNFCAPNKLIWGDMMPVGGGILCEGSSPTISHCTITVNTAHTIGGGGFGGGIYCGQDSDPIITHCNISNNDSYWGAGGIDCTDGSATIIDCTVAGNRTGWSGGGIGCSSSTTITGCIVSNNSGSGGGIRGSATITDSIITGNWATFSGGGGILGAPTISDSTISNNTVFEGEGGGILCTGNATIDNCVITGNSAHSGGEPPFYWFEGIGGGISSWEWTPSISRCTIADNWAESTGGAIHGTAEITSSILWNNAAPNDPEIYGSCVVSYTDVRGGYLGPGNIDADPCFADPCDGDYHLQSEGGRWDPNSESWVLDGVTSPCIDKGNFNSPVGDEPYPNGGKINMGAYGGTVQASKSPVVTCWEAAECAGQRFGDATCNGAVDLADLLALKAGFAESAPWIPPVCCTDFNHDDSVNLGDLLVLKAGFSTSGYSPSTLNQDCPP